jgi:hypothetical protein
MTKKEKKTSLKTRGRNTLLIFLLLFGGIAIFGVFGITSYTLTSYTQQFQGQGSFYSITTGWLDLGVSCQKTGGQKLLQNTGDIPNIVIDPDDPIKGGADIKLDLGTPYLSDIDGNPSASTDPRELLTRIIEIENESYLYVFELYHFSLELQFRTLATVIN